MGRWKPRSMLHPPLMSDILARVWASSPLSPAMMASLDRSTLCAAASSSLNFLRKIIANLMVRLEDPFHRACARLPERHLMINTLILMSVNNIHVTF